MEENDKRKADKEREGTYLAQWQTCVEMANAASQRRDVMNGLFVTVNLAIVAAVSIVWDIKAVCMSVAGVFICIAWILLIISYRKLSQAKYDVIDELENMLPYKPFTNEWENLKKKKKHYPEETWIEISLAAIFLAGYVVLSIIIGILGG